MLITCPLPTELGNIVISNCPEDVGQIYKLVFQRVFSSGSTKNSFTISSANPNLQASWDTFLDASDSTKAVQTPFLDNPESEAGGPVTYGGGNATRGGISLIVGREPSTFNAEFLRTSQASIKDLKTYEAESYNGNLGVYFIDEYGRIIGKSDNIDSPTIFYPIPIHSLFISDKMFGGFAAPDKNTMQFQMFPNWSDDLHIVTPSNFDALTDLVE